MGLNRTPLTEDQFEKMRISTDWSIDEVPPDVWDNIPKLPRRDNLLCVMASGTITDSRILNGIYAIGGMDVLAIEDNRQPNEPEGNSYHLVFAKINDPRYPYLMIGPFKSETRVPHWYNADDLSVYWSEGTTCSGTLPE
jgi:hypothetical protein